MDNMTMGRTPKGIFRFHIMNREGKIIETDIKRNLIVDLGRNNIANILSNNGSSLNIEQIGFGENTSPASPSDTGLSVSAHIKNIDSITYPATGSVAFVWSLDYTEGNGLNITEFGLFTQSNVLFARRVRDIIVKTSDIRLTGTWTLIF